MAERVASSQMRVGNGGRATAAGWWDRLESDRRRGRRRRRWASEPQQIPSAGTWT